MEEPYGVHFSVQAQPAPPHSRRPGKYIAAILTIARADLVANEPVKLNRDGSL